MGNNMILVPENVCDGGTAYTGQGGAEVQQGNHGDQEPSRVTSLSGMLPTVSQFRVEPELGGIVDFLGIVNHNLDSRRGSYWRGWACDRGEQTFDIFEPLELLYPTIPDASSNLTGTYTDVDDDPWLAASSADFLQPAGAGDWSARFGFATPSAPLSDVGNDHLFVLRVFPGLSVNSGTITVRLYEGGSLVATLINADTVGATDRLERVIYAIPFSTSQLGTASGANVQIQIDATNEVRVASVLWVAGLAVTNAGDTGFVAVPLPPASAAFGSISAGRYQEPMPIEFARLSTAIDLTDAEIPMAAAAFVNATNEASPTNELGVLVSGKTFEFDANPESAEFYVEDRSQRIESAGGQDSGPRLRPRRVFRIPLQLVSPSQHVEIVERLDWRKGQVGAFYVNLFPNDATLSRLWGAWVRIAEPGAWIPHSESGGYFFNRTYLFREKL